MWIGFWVSKGFAALGMTLPAYIGAMLVAAVIRNIDNATGWFSLSHRFINTFGIVSLTLFLVMALMTLKLWELTGLVLPLLAILVVQVVIAALAAAGPVFRLMGGNYEAAVMSGGFIGFMLGTTANAMAVMRALTERYGPAPRAFLVAPDRRRVLHRLHECAHHHAVPEPARLSTGDKPILISAAAGSPVRATSPPDRLARRPSRRGAGYEAHRDPCSGRRPRE